MFVMEGVPESPEVYKRLGRFSSLPPRFQRLLSDLDLMQEEGTLTIR